MNTIKSWHISTITLVLVILGVVITGQAGNTGIGAILLLSLFPILVWFGWTLNDRSKYRYVQLEQKVLKRIKERTPEDIVNSRKMRSENV